MIILTYNSKAELSFQFSPSPFGLPDSENTGKNHRVLSNPNTCAQFSE